MLAIYGTGRYGTLVRQATRMRLSEQPVRELARSTRDLDVVVTTSRAPAPSRPVRGRVEKPATGQCAMTKMTILLT